MKLQLNRNETLAALLEQEDTDGSKTITVEDKGPKQFELTANDGTRFTVKGTYRLANLLQELWLSADGTIDTELIEMPPLARIDHMMRTHYWKTLTRQIDDAGLKKTLADEKRSPTDKQYLYVPESDTEGVAYYRRLAEAHPSVELSPVPETLTNDYLKSIERKPGLLALKYDAERQKPIPYVVPGGRFNEMYGWDSYFIARGLMVHDQYELTRSMLENMAYQIKHYGKVLNANRSYYLTRSHPPVYAHFLHTFIQRYGDRVSKDWLREHLGIAIKEHDEVWMNPATRLTPIGLNRYFAQGKGRPRETEHGHFDFIMQQHADRHGLSLRDFKDQYDNEQLEDADLDRYFVHDRSMRESGLDTTTRYDDCCADLASVDLNSMLYRAETDIASLIDSGFEGRFEYQGQIHTGDDWRAKAARRQALMKQYLWHEADGCFYDYNVTKGAPQPFVSITNLLPLWAGCCTADEAMRLVTTHLPALIKAGGIASTGPVDKREGPDRQWDAPYGWAPHQIMLWEGLSRYGFEAEARQAAMAWMRMVVRAAVDYNGLIPEKFNVERASHKVDAEYGNVGAVFEYVPAGGFGWTNSAFLLGLQYLDEAQKAELNALAD
ncbi:MAG: trehalase family glycosidase [Lautropia sp.]|nr:trehalase family glycosidase [Lautropia sp.]